MTTYNTGPLPDPCIILALIVWTEENTPLHLTSWLRLVENEIIQLIA